MTGKLEERSLNFDHIQEYSLTYFVITEGKKEYRLHLFCCDFENGNYWSGSCNRYQPAFILYFYSGIFNEKPGKLSCKTT